MFLSLEPLPWESIDCTLFLLTELVLISLGCFVNSLQWIVFYSWFTKRGCITRKTCAIKSILPLSCVIDFQNKRWSLPYVCSALISFYPWLVRGRCYDDNDNDGENLWIIFLKRFSVIPNYPRKPDIIRKLEVTQFFLSYLILALAQSRPINTSVGII